MRFVLSVCIALVFSSGSALHAQAPAAAKPAQEKAGAQSRRPAAPAPQAATSPVATPAPKKKGFLQRVFTGGEKKAAATTPAPASAATPSPATPRPRQKRRPATAREAAPAVAKADASSEAAPEPKKSAKPKTSKTAPAKADEESEPQEALTPEQQALKQAEASNDPGEVEKAKYDLAKATAVQDEKIVALKEKADAANDEEDGRNALRAYNKALFQKMRTIDGSIRERIDLMEDAVMKRLEPATAKK